MVSRPLTVPYGAEANPKWRRKLSHFEVFLFSSFISSLIANALYASQWNPMMPESCMQSTLHFPFLPPIRDCIAWSSSIISFADFQFHSDANLEMNFRGFSKLFHPENAIKTKQTLTWRGSQSSSNVIEKKTSQDSNIQEHDEQWGRSQEPPTFTA